MSCELCAEECLHCKLYQEMECEGRLEGEIQDGCPDFEQFLTVCELE